MVGTKVHQAVFLFISFLNFVLGLGTYLLPIHKPHFAYFYFFPDKRCNVSDLIQNQCSDTEMCVPSQTSIIGVCICIDGYKRVNGTCYMKPTDPPSRASFVSDDDQSSGHVVAGVLISIFVITLVVCGVYISYRYRLIAWVRNKMNQRNVDYDEFMIGQDPDDDPPLN